MNWLRNIFTGVALLLLANMTLQAKMEARGFAHTDYSPYPAKVTFHSNQLSSRSTSQAVPNMVVSLIDNLQHKDVSLNLQHHAVSPMGEHFQYEQYFKGIKIYGSQIKANINHYNELKSLIDNSFNVKGWDASLELSKEFDYTQTTHYQNFTSHFFKKDFKVILSEKVIGYDFTNKLPYTAYQVRLLAENSYQFVELLITEEEIPYYTDLNTYVRLDSSGTVKVFDPDPITSAQTQYGQPGFVDNGDQNSSQLSGERVVRSIPLEFETLSNTFFLENPYIKINDNVSDPRLGGSYSYVSNTLDFERNEKDFEAHMCMYHISTYKEYLDDLINTSWQLVNNQVNPPVTKPVTTLVDYQIVVDPHGMDGLDQSQFRFGANPPEIHLGTGFVDDAEDADVIIHEYSHAISHSASPGTNVGEDRRALDEGFSDYIAASYSKSINTYEWQKLFNWDGQNEFWDGRPIVTSKTYSPPDQGESIYIRGQIWSGMLMNLNSREGREVADQLAILVMYCMAQNMTMPQAAQMLLQADSSIFNAQHICVLEPLLFYRNLIPSIDADCDLLNASVVIGNLPDTTVCLGTNFTLGGDPTSLNANDEYLWYPPNKVNETLANPVYFVTSSQLFTVRVTDSLGFYNIKQQFVRASKCVDDYRDFQFLNSLAWAEGSGPFRVFIPGNFRSVTVRLFDMRGKLIRNYDNVSGYFLEIPPNGIAADNYVIMAEERYIRKSIKLTKWSSD